MKDDVKNLTVKQKSLLLYLESRVVDHGGLVDTAKMNEEDTSQAEQWNELGFIGYGRIRFRDMEKMRNSRSCMISHWCELSEQAWILAHEERKIRAARMSQKRTWKKTLEE